MEAGVAEPGGWAPRRGRTRNRRFLLVAHRRIIALNVPAWAITSLRIVSVDGIALATLRLPPPLSAGGAGIAPLRMARDGRIGPDPAPDREGRGRDQRWLGHRQGRPLAAGAGDPGRGRAASGPDGRAAHHRRQGVGGGRVRPARAHVRTASAPGAGLLRHPADGAADVAGDGRFAVDPLLPGLWPDLPHPELL